MAGKTVRKKKSPKTGLDCFLISPIGSKGSDVRRRANQLLSKLIRPALSRLDIIVKRADEAFLFGSITDQMINRICDCRLCIVNLTDLNPNVMYELGIRHAWDLPVICLAEEGTKLPFDIKDCPTLFYSMENVAVINRSRRLLTSQVRAVMANGAINGSAPIPRGQIRVFTECLTTVSRWRTYILLIMGQQTILNHLRRQLRRILREVKQDFENGNGSPRPLTLFANMLSEEFTDFSAQMSIIEQLSDIPNHSDGLKQFCLQTLSSMEKLKRDAVKTCGRWRQSKATKAAFVRAVSDLEYLVEAIGQIYDSLESS